MHIYTEMAKLWLLSSTLVLLAWMYSKYSVIDGPPLTNNGKSYNIYNIIAFARFIAHGLIPSLHGIRIGVWE